MASFESQTPAFPRFIWPPWLSGKRGLIGVGMIGYMVFFLAWIYFQWGGDENISLIGNLAILPPVLVAALMAWRVAFQARFDPRLRWAWFLLGAGSFCYFLGEATWTYLENVLQTEPFPSIADVFFLCYYPLMLWGLMLLPGSPQNRRERLIFWFDLLIMLTVASMFVSYFLILPTAEVNNSDFFTKLLAIAYPVGSLILLGGTLALLFKQPEADTRAVLLLAGISFFLASDLAFGYTSLAGTYVAGSWIDAGWHLAQVFTVLAVLRQLHWGTVPSSNSRWIAIHNGIMKRIPLLTALLGLGLVFYIALTNFNETVEWIFIAAALLPVLIIARQIFIAGFTVTSVRTKLSLTFLLVSVSAIELVSIFSYFTLRVHPDSVWQVFFVNTIIILILTTGAAIFLAQRFVSPISRLTLIAQQITAGDLSAKAQIESQDEIGTLARAFNTMLDALSQARQELHENEALYRSLVDHSPDVIIVHSKGEILFINPAGVKVLGAKSPEELIGQPILDLIPAQDREHVKQGIEHLQTIKGPTPLLQQTMHRLDGSRFESEFMAIPISYAGQPATQFVMRDITERKRLEEQWNKFKLGLERSNEAVFMTDVNGTIRYINPAFEKLYGYSWDEAVGQTPRILKSGAVSLDVYQHFWETLLAKGIVKGELVNKAKDGRLINIEGSANPILDDSGNLLGFLAVQRDITERKRAEEQIKQLLSEVERQNAELEVRVEQRTTELNKLNLRLQEELSERQQLLQSLSDSEARFRLLFEASPDAILLIDPYDRNTSWPIVGCNEAACTMNGYTREELIGQSIDILNERPGNHAEREAYLEFLRKQGILHKDGVHRHKSGHLFPIEVSTSLISFAGREMVLGIDRDITERKLTEIALQQAKEMAEAANRAKSEFLSRMSHELRTPMNAILGFAQLLEMSRKEPLTSTQQERVKQIVKGGKHLLDLINEILDISRIEAGRLQISPEPVSIRDSIQEALDLTEPLAANRQIQLQACLELESNPYVMADRQRLKQVLLNLLSNAVKYNFDGGSIKVTCQQSPSNHWRISVTDTGSGIHPENIGRLFIPFERLVIDQSNVEGTGLGLALAKRLVELMQGRIGVESIVGQGSTFWIELPGAESQVERLKRTGGTGPLPEMPATARSILYIEDNIANFELIQQVLADYTQIELLWATNLEAGLELAHRHHPNLILLDLHLGSKDGAEVLRQLKREGDTKEIPVVMVSADATPGQIKRMILLGAHSYLTKPLDMKHFIRLIEELLNEEVH